MSRIPPDVAAPEVKRQKSEELITQIRQYRLITPLFGGGVVTNENDPVTIIRPSEVRGHLRFWWRATRARSYNNLIDVKRAEDKIWGSTSSPSHIIVKITSISDTKKSEPAFQVAVEKNKKKIKSSPQIAPYAAFPLLPEKEEQRMPGWKSEEITYKIEFCLAISFPSSLSSDVNAALWAWEIFGGIGARTRRGFGALQCMKVEGHDIKPPNKMGIDAFINCGLQDYVTEKNPPHKGIPCLCQKLRFRTVNSQSDITGAWQGIIEQYQDFRQRRYGNKYGLSQWPEANEVRRYYKKPHKLPADIEDDALIEKFPRAKFGLPIEFHMPHDGDMKPQLQGINYDPDNDKWYNRLASPLILRPIACSDGAVGLAAILEWQPMEADDEPYTPPGGLILKGAPGDPAVSSELTQAEAKVILPLHGNTDILQAFLDSLR